MNTVEISIDSVESAVAAEQGGAQRVELCSGLREGGLTPSLGLIRAVRARVAIDLFVLIRPRGGDFLYSDEEFRIMQDDIALAAQEGVNGLVLGILTADGDVDEKRTQALVAPARPLQVTFHRAFDLARDLDSALEAVIRCGATRILTSGGQQSALLGRERLQTLARAAGSRITMLAGGGVRPANVAELAQATGISEFHSSMRRVQPSPMRYRVPHMHLGEPGVDEYARSYILAEDVRALANAAQTVAVS